ncbi:MAG: sterol desaturase family protein [Xanthomonadales bacterium]|nr:sterol desaturase family protein [Xanthomonadales bacterium]
MLDGYILQLSLSLLIGAVITFAIVLGLEEWKIGSSKDIKKQKFISISTVIPNILLYFLVTPYWGLVYLNLEQYALFQITNLFWAVPLALIMCDFSYYWEHRAAHKFTFLWKLYHGTHHTGIDFNIPLAYRVNGLNLLIAPIFYLPWILIGIEPILIIGMQLFVFHFQGWLHTNLIGEMTKFDRWFNSPANHRMHHSADIKHKDVNFAAIFMLWDKIFGTCIKPEGNLRYGINEITSDNSYIKVYTNPWK